MILVHDWDENRGVFHPVALWMQNTLKMSVIAPDLRGHGNSKQVRGFNDPIDRERLKGPTIDRMTMDIEACKSYLMKRNNEGKLNIEQLGVLGCGFGAGLAVKWSIGDWQFPDLGRLKQGRDVKALILSLAHPFFPRQLDQPGSETENDPRQHLDTDNCWRRGYQEHERGQADQQLLPERWRDEAENAAPFFPAATSLQNTDLLKSRGTGVDREIGKFLTRRLIQLGDRFLWTDRQNPLK